MSWGKSAVTFSISIISTDVQGTAPSIAESDINGPELITYEIVQFEEQFFGEQVFLYDVRDTESGILFVEISEDGGRYSRAEQGMFILTPNTKEIDVKMVDKAGNITVKHITLENMDQKDAWKWYPISVFVVFILLILFVQRWLHKRSRK